MNEYERMKRIRYAVQVSVFPVKEVRVVIPSVLHYLLIHLYLVCVFVCFSFFISFYFTVCFLSIILVFILPSVSLSQMSLPSLSLVAPTSTSSSQQLQLF